MTTHYRDRIRFGEINEWAACGVRHLPHVWSFTENVSLVTCKRCIRSRDFEIATERAAARASYSILTAVLALARAGAIVAESKRESAVTRIASMIVTVAALTIAAGSTHERSGAPESAANAFRRSRAHERGSAALIGALSVGTMSMIVALAPIVHTLSGALSPLAH